MRRPHPLPLVALALALAAPAAHAVSTTIVISEFRTRGPLGASDEFVEIWNRSNATVLIAGMKLAASNSAGTTSVRATVSAGVTLGPGCHFLFANSAFASGPPPANQVFATGITDDGGIAILDASNVVIDAVGMSAGSAYKEGATLAPLTGTADQSYERKPGGSSGSGIDTDSNANDFVLVTPSARQNMASGCLASTPAHEPTWGAVKLLYR